MSLWGALGSIAGSFFGPAGTAIGGAIGSAIDGNNAASDARSSLQAGTDAAAAETRRQFDLIRSDNAPFQAAAVDALGQLRSEMNRPTTAADVMADPGYQFGLDQGTRALNNRIAASGGRVSGAALKAATRFGTDYGSTGYGAAYQRGQDRLNRLAAIARIGQTSTGTTAQAGMNAGNALSNLLTAQGNANAGADVAKGSIWANTGNQLAALLSKNTQTTNPFPQWGLGGGFGSGTGGMGD